LVGKPERKRPLRIPWHRYKDIIKVNPKKIRYLGVNWIHLAQDRAWFQALVNTTVNLPFRSGGEFLD
jgi:hypothetical protein